MLLLDIIIVVASVGGVLIIFNMLMGYRKGYLTLNLKKRYKNVNDHGKAVEEELTEQGKEAVYEGHGYFLIDGKSYMLIVRTLPMGGVPLQRTILKPLKGDG